MMGSRMPLRSGTIERPPVVIERKDRPKVCFESGPVTSSQQVGWREPIDNLRALNHPNFNLISTCDRGFKTQNTVGN